MKERNGRLEGWKIAFMKYRLFLFFIIPSFLLFFLLSFSAFAQVSCIPSKPSPPRLVNNLSKEFPDFISSYETEQLEQKLVAFNDSTSNQIVIVIVDDLCGYDANEFSTRLGQQWGVGQGKFDNGVVIMIKPTGGAGQRDAYIAVGYGLEGIIPDITANQILDNEIIPRFKQGNNYEALDAATDVLMSLAHRDFSYKDYQKGNNAGPWFPFIVFAIVFLFFVIMSFRRRSYTMTSRGRTYYGGGWFGGGGGSWGGGGGGGGFGGFGGGGFGGGGAGGKW